jgi:hypothetical protein
VIRSSLSAGGLQVKENQHEADEDIEYTADL